MDNPEKFVHISTKFIKNIDNASYNEMMMMIQICQMKMMMMIQIHQMKLIIIITKAIMIIIIQRNPLKKISKNFVRSLSKSYRFDSDVYFSYNGSKVSLR